MKKQLRRLFCILSVLTTLALTAYPAMAADKPMQGIFGDDLTWRFTPSNNTLTVEGTGEMPSRLLWEFDCYGTLTPWDVRKITHRIEHVVIGEGVTEIGAAMFQYCAALRHVQLPDSLRRIGSCAFEHTPLAEVCIPKGVEEIGFSAFAYCDDLRSVTFKGFGIMHIDAHAFGSTPFLEKAPYDRNGLLIRDGHLLAAKTDLQGVCVIPEGVRDIADFAFTDYMPECEVNGVNISKVIFPESLKYIGDFAFYNCEKLAYAVFPSENIRFGCSPFEDTALSEKEIRKYSAACYEEPHDAPAPTEYRISAADKDYAMHSYEKTADDDYDCFDRLQTYVVDPDNPYYKAVDGVLYSKDGTILLRYPCGRTADTFVVPQGVKVIGAFAFQQYNIKDPVGLRKVVLPEGVTVIRECAFDGCPNLEQVVLPSTLKTIEAGAFSGNRSLKTIELPDGLQEIGECFLTDSQVTHVRIPDSVVCFHGGAFNSSQLQTLEGYDRVPYKSEYAMEGGSFYDTPYQKALDGMAEEEPEPTAEPKPEPTAKPKPEPKKPTLMICGEQNEEVTQAYGKVGFFKQYKDRQIRLHTVSELPDNVRVRWCSDNQNITVDENGLVTNRLNGKAAATITVLAMQANGTVLLKRQVRVYFYRFDSQLRRLQESETR